jgi:glycosyltransferase involved in cell wall biosynthesis
MSAAPRVSAITIFLDAAPFLDEAAQSVFSQTCSDWELLLVDDGSSDGSSEIARRLAVEQPGRVRYLEHPGHANLGMSAARNLGIDASRGDVIAFLDADDVWLPNKLSEQLAILDEHPRAAMVYGRTEIWHSWDTATTQSDYFYDLGVAPDRVIESTELFALLLANRAQTPTTCNAAMRRDTVRMLGGFEAQFRGLYEDQVFFAKLHLAAPSYVSSHVWARYRQHPASSMADVANEPYHETRLRLLEWIAAYVDAHPEYDSAAARSALATEIWRCRHPRVGRLYDRVAGSLRAIAARASGRATSEAGKHA